MGKIKITKGLNLPIAGEPVLTNISEKKVSKVAVLSDDYVGLKPTFVVQEGDNVKLGQVLFTDKKNPKVKYTAPGSGKVVEINRGEKRAFRSLVIQLEGNEEETFSSYSLEEIKSFDFAKVSYNLLESGLWTSIRTRPFSKVADPDKRPHSVFVNAMDTNPLSAPVLAGMGLNDNEIEAGFKVISALTDGKVYFCTDTDTNINTPKIDKLETVVFDGPHPAGLVGTHIHFLDPVGKNKTVWHLSFLDLIRIGKFFLTGKIPVETVVSLAGPGVKSPGLVKTRLGASVEDLTNGELTDQKNRIISGSVLSGHIAAAEMAFIGRFHRQISVVPEASKRVFFGWLASGIDKFSLKNVVLSKLIPNKKFKFDTDIHGGHRAIVPVGSYEKVMPLDIIPTYLLRALTVNDVEESEKLGCLELDEEDLALCTFVCPSKNDYGPILRRNLNLIEKEG